jgi:hypothetical protein
VQSRNKFEERMISPDGAGRNRERRLASLMPTTLHMLRTYPPLQQKLAALEVQGVARWQVEQAIVNQRLWSQVQPEQRSRLQNENDLSITPSSNLPNLTRRIGTLSRTIKRRYSAKFFVMCAYCSSELG